VRRYGAERARLENFIPVDILSLAPRDDFFQPRSWRVAGGWRRSFLRDGAEPLVPGIDGGAGSSWSLAGGRALAYAMAEAGLRAHHSLEHGYGIGAGARLGALVDLGARWRMHAYASGLDYFLGEPDQPRRLGLESRFSLGRNLALRADLGTERQAGRRFGSGSISLMAYF
jgi:hypothetical protein